MGPPMRNHHFQGRSVSFREGITFFGSRINIYRLHLPRKIPGKGGGDCDSSRFFGPETPVTTQRLPTNKTEKPKRWPKVSGQKINRFSKKWQIVTPNSLGNIKGPGPWPWNLLNKVLKPKSSMLILVIYEIYVPVNCKPKHSCCSLPPSKFNSSPLKNGAWKMILPGIGIR